MKAVKKKYHIITVQETAFLLFTCPWKLACLQFKITSKSFTMARKKQTIFLFQLNMMCSIQVNHCIVSTFPCHCSKWKMKILEVFYNTSLYIMKGYKGIIYFCIHHLYSLIHSPCYGLSPKCKVPYFLLNSVVTLLFLAYYSHSNVVSQLRGRIIQVTFGMSSYFSSILQAPVLFSNFG